jgi:CoA:oxalate CoA-transferase
MGREDMITDPKYSKAEARRLNKKEITEEITKFTKQRTLDECEKIMNDHGVPNGRINTMTMICADPQIAARKMIVEVEHPIAGKYKMAGSPIKFSNYPDTTYEAAPMLGQHTRDILKSYIGMNDQELDKMLSEQDKLLKSK